MKITADKLESKFKINIKNATTYSIIPLVLLFILINSCTYRYDPYHITTIPDLPHSLKGIKKMYLMSGNRFWMGDHHSKYPDEKPARWVSLDQFYIDETPVTYADFEKYVGQGGQHGAYHMYDSYNHSDYPITGITWYHAIDFCNWRSKVEGFEPAYYQTNQRDVWGYPLWKLKDQANGFRLPTEAEFEYAARGGQQKKQFPWGDQFDTNRANLDTEKGQKKGKKWRIVAVKSEKPNRFGLYQMTGNIQHWCQDWYDVRAYQHLSQQNPLERRLKRTKALRGGGWGATHPNYLRVAKRSFCAPSNYNFDIGFRCVLPAKALITETKQDAEMGLGVAHDFFRTDTSHICITDHNLDFTSEKFTKRLGKYFADYFPNSIYFRQKVDQQNIITPFSLAHLVVKIASEHKINPLFLAAIMVSESGVGSCSFPRWFNNPLAFRWQNRLMSAGLPTYANKPNVQNRKFIDLEANFKAFCQGIRRELYYQASRENLTKFHLVYVGYEADEWMRTLTRVYKDVAQVRFESNYPSRNAGKFIYLDWAKIKVKYGINQKKRQQRNTSDQNLEQSNQFLVRTQKTQRYYLIHGSFGTKKRAVNYIKKKKYDNIENLEIIHYQNRFRVALASFEDEKTATKKQAEYATTYKGIWVMKF